MTHVMLDLETMGNDSNAAIIAIGACTFSAKGIGEQFYEVIDLHTSVRCGGVMDAGTVLWWMKQNDAARSAFDKKGVHIIEALQNFANWMKPNSYVWGNGAAFDNVILSNAYKRNLIEVPWHFWNDRCYRTVKARSKIPMPQFKGVAHNALDDAINQAQHLISIDATVNNV